MPAYPSFLPGLAEQCCDAGVYLYLAKFCAEGGIDGCWHNLRPMGAQLYFSLPLRLGLGEDGVVPFNALALCLSALGAVAVTLLLPRSDPSRSGPGLWVQGLLGLAFLGIHVAFAGAMVRYALTDLPAGAATLVGVWLLVVGAVRGGRLAFLGAGFAIGASATIRAFYFYPALICGVVVAAICARQRATWVGGFLFLLGLAAPLYVQIGFTHRLAGTWAFMESSSVGLAFRDQLTDTAYGRETILPRGVFVYDAPNCFERTHGLADAIQKHAWSEALCLIGYKEWFYFGSYTPAGRVYLHAPSERIFSVPVLIANIGALLAATVWVLRHARQHPLLIAAFLYLGAIWAEASSLRPEARYIVVVHIAAWIFALAGAAEMGLRLQKRLH